MNIPELKTQIAAEREGLKAFWESFPEKKLADGTVARDIPAEKLVEFNQRHEALDKLSADLANLKKTERFLTGEPIDDEPANRKGGGAQREERKSLADQFLGSDQFKAGGGSGKVQAVQCKFDLFDRKASMGASSTFGAGYQVENTRDGDFVPYLNISKPKVINLVPTQATGNETIQYVRQTARTNAAAAKKEGQALAQSDWTVATVTDPLRVVGHYIDVTLQQLNDVQEAQGLINQELPNMVMEELERLYLVGSGSGNEFYGVYNDTHAQSQARGSDTNIDQILKGITKVETYSDDQMPDLVVLTPLAWQNIMLLKTADGVYLYGNPAGRTLDSIWGLRTVKSQKLTSATGLVFDSGYFPLVYRQQMQIDVTDSDGEKFQNLIYAMRAFVRAGVKHRRGQAACKLTSVNES